MKINVLGWYRDNIGDESYKLAFPILFPEASFVFSDAPAPGNFDITILGGGDILSESYLKRLLSAKSPKKIAFSVSANTNSPISLIKQLDDLYIRDKKSIDLLKSQGVDCKFLPDIAFSLTPNQEDGQKWIKTAFQAEHLDLYEKKVGIVLNAHLSQGKPDLLTRDFLNLMKVSWDLSKLMDETSASFVLFPMSTRLPYDDRVTNAMMGSRCKFWQKNLIVYDRLSVQDTLNLVSAMDVVISTRLHSSIFSSLSNVPFIDLTHHDKNSSFLETIGLQDWSHSYWHFEYSIIKEKLKKLLINSEIEKNLLQEKTNEFRKILNNSIIL